MANNSHGKQIPDTPTQVMELLHELFTKYDRLCRQHGVYKVETVGDCYMACTGVVTENPDHAARMLTFAQDMLETATGMGWPLGGCVRVRIGVHSGRVMSGVVGSIRARYCLFGDTVNTASRMQSTGVVDHIQVSAATYELLEPQQQSCFEPREGVAVKGKGVMHTWLLGPATAQEQS
jgi:class 3 adenylate cyclase